MANYPSNFQTKERLQPGGRGEIFQVDIPGYRDGADRINRTNEHINTSAHDVPNIKYLLDNRLPVLFKYGFAFGYNQMVAPKGRIAALDQTMNQLDWDEKKAHNVVTMANGGVNTYLPANGEQIAGVTYDGKTWVSTDKDLTVDPDTGLAVVDGKVDKRYRFANQPIGVFERNEYTRDDNAFNGMMVSPILTDAMIELPWFSDQTHAEGNPWGSAYGAIKPGDYVKSDINGRFVKSGLSDKTFLETATIAQYEHERQQTIGQVYETSKELIPAGAAKYAQWALSDILNFEGFNPDIYRQNNRRGEDNINNSPYNSDGKYPGYPYDKAYMNSDLHMLESYRKTYDQRMQDQYRYDHGIPGLTDGYNAITKPYSDKNVAYFGSRGDCDEYIDVYVRTNQVNVEEGTLQISLGDTAFAPCTQDAVLTATVEGETGDIAKVKYVSELQGIVCLEMIKTAADTFFNTIGQDKKVSVSFKYNKRGESGVPTFMDWDGCMGSVKILLQK